MKKLGILDAVLSIDVYSLPYCLLSKRQTLPAVPAVYFAIDPQNTVLYVGKADNLNNRWRNHDKGIDLAFIGEIKIHYLEVDELLTPSLCEIEKILIKKLKPSMNKTHTERVRRKKSKPAKAVQTAKPKTEKEPIKVEVVCDKVDIQKYPNLLKIQETEADIPIEYSFIFSPTSSKDFPTDSVLEFAGVVPGVKFVTARQACLVLLVSQFWLEVIKPKKKVGFIKSEAYAYANTACDSEAKRNHWCYYASEGLYGKEAEPEEIYTEEELKKHKKLLNSAFLQEPLSDVLEKLTKTTVTKR